MSDISKISIKELKLKKGLKLNELLFQVIEEIQSIRRKIDELDNINDKIINNHNQITKNYKIISNTLKKNNII